MTTDPRIDILKQAVANSRLDGPTKDSLADALAYAQSVNGSTEPALLAVKHMVVLGVRRELSLHDHIAKAIKEHAGSCPFHEVPKLKIERVMEAIRPAMWPVAIVCFSPFGAGIIRQIFTAFLAFQTAGGAG